MTTVSATPAQRLTARDKCAIAVGALWPVAQNSYTPNAAEGAVIDTALLAAANSIGALGATAALPSTQVVVSDTQASVVTDNSGGPSVAMTLIVTASALVRATMTSATDCIVQSGNATSMQNSAGTAIPGTHPATVAGGTVTHVKLAATVGVVVNAVKQSGWNVTGTGTFFTPTIVAGVCTGGVLSAS